MRRRADAMPDNGVGEPYATCHGRSRGLSRLSRLRRAGRAAPRRGRRRQPDRGGPAGPDDGQDQEILHDRSQRHHGDKLEESAPPADLQAAHRRHHGRRGGDPAKSTISAAWRSCWTPSPGRSAMRPPSSWQTRHTVRAKPTPRSRIATSRRSSDGSSTGRTAVPPHPAPAVRALLGRDVLSGRALPLRRERRCRSLSEKGAS